MNPSAGPAAPTRRVDLRAVLSDVGRTVARGWIAIAYAVVVVAVAVVLWAQPTGTTDQYLEQFSTNLDNLTERPLSVLVSSAFVISTPGELVLVGMLLVTLAYLQRYLGVLGVFLIGVAGHVGATLVVALGLSAGIFHGFLPESVVSAEDVGVSYVLAASMATAALFVPRPWTWPYLAATWAFFLFPVVAGVTFTSVGHTTALLVGTCIAVLGTRFVRADRAGRLPERSGVGRSLGRLATDERR
ncbi:hypothetical protein GCM10025865_23710 [Paraoerskovia sediminicola]|uniref:Rhomboid family intramembrane serine protease n=1 Tax=Paraoerskovia sediminicola TaxID=1138587 RepID=A0ABN6XDR2_9CELL|nr:rhomboid-like protein [Paraoerskovia sediminicola]BDZ43072.1 hypothetical protein GCM10025865_23710 [Paraoerskovia sediminicola]